MRSENQTQNPDRDKKAHSPTLMPHKQLGSGTAISGEYVPWLVPMPLNNGCCLHQNELSMSLIPVLKPPQWEHHVGLPPNIQAVMSSNTGKGFRWWAWHSLPQTFTFPSILYLLPLYLKCSIKLLFCLLKIFFNPYNIIPIPQMGTPSILVWVAIYNKMP